MTQLGGIVKEETADEKLGAESAPCLASCDDRLQERKERGDEPSRVVGTPEKKERENGTFLVA